MLFGNGDEDWSIESEFSAPQRVLVLTGCAAITEAVKADHGFTIDSQPIHDLLSIMSEYDAVARRDFLQFITGSPKLPIGGKTAAMSGASLVLTCKKASVGLIPLSPWSASRMKLPSLLTTTFRVS